MSPQADPPSRHTAIYRDDRLVDFEGAYNFRDIGGYAGHGGRPVRKGLVFRSDNLHSLSDADMTLFAQLDIKVVHDFRLESERSRQPSRLPGPASRAKAPEVVLLSVNDAEGIDAAIVEVVADALSGKRPFPPPSFWDDSADVLVDRARPMFAELLNSIAQSERLPAVYHCAAGKDRTGLATALIHHLLGVSDEDIMTDYLLTNVYRLPVRMAALMPQLSAIGVSEAQAVPVLGVSGDALTRMMAKIDGRYGGPERYLLGAGMEGDVPDRIRTLLLEP